MTSAWLLPEHLADVLPAQAQALEALRATLLGIARGYGYELVVPPLLEHVESLLSGSGRALDLRTFRLVDQLSGRQLGLRADTTPQVARIDAHLLNRDGVVRLCYCGPVLHTRPRSPLAGREPLQFGAEVYGHAGLEADLEVMDLAIDGLQAAGLQGLVLDLADARLLRGVLAGLPVDAQALRDVAAALADKNLSQLQGLVGAFPAATRQALLALPQCYGGPEVLARARALLPERTQVLAALDDLAQLHRHLSRVHTEVSLGFDLADVGGDTYYSGVRFAAFAQGQPDAVMHGGRYDEVGAAFGRNRPAVGCSTDVKMLAALTPPPLPAAAVRAPWGQADPELHRAVRELRANGHTVVCMLPGHEDENEALSFDRELVHQAGRWVLRAL